jgi:perosamine synthetase
MKKHNIRLMMPDVGSEELLAVQAVLESGQLVEGAKAHEFEELISNKSGTKHTVLCTSATVGLELALKALNLNPSDEVLLPAFTHPATLLAVLNVGLTPVLVDVDPITFNTNAELLEKGISQKTKVLIPVSWGGYPIDIVPIMNLAKLHNCYVIEDAACALGTAYNGIKTGSMADMTVYSFHPRKLIALGDGGAVTTNNEIFYKKLKKLKHFGSETINNKISFVEPGGNFRLSNILAAMGIPQIEKLDRTIAMRTEKANYYNKIFSNIEGINIPHVTSKMLPNYQSYCLSFSKKGARDYLLQSLKEMGIEVQFGTYSIDLQPVCKEVKKVQDLSGSHFLGDHLLTLPLHHKLTQSEQDSVCKEITACLYTFVS